MALIERTHTRRFQPRMKTTHWKPAARRLWLEWLKPCLVILLVTSALRSALADWNDVPTGSMKPTILEGDRVWEIGRAHV